MDNINFKNQIQPLLISFYQNLAFNTERTKIIADISNICQEIIKETKMITMWDSVIEDCDIESKDSCTHLRQISMARCAEMYLKLLLTIDPENQTLFRQELIKIIKFSPAEFWQDKGFSLS